MGGIGSTRWNRHNRKLTTGECLNVSIVDLYRRHWHGGILRRGGCQSGTLTWSRGAQVVASMNWQLDVFGERRMLTLSYKRNGVPSTFVIPVQSTPVLNGVRWWLMCPLCDRRCGVLYLPPRADGFACRKCHNLTYASSQEAHTLDNMLRSMGLPPSAAKVLKSTLWR